MTTGERTDARGRRATTSWEVGKKNELNKVLDIPHGARRSPLVSLTGKKRGLGNGVEV